MSEVRKSIIIETDEKTVSGSEIRKKFAEPEILLT